VSSLSPTERLLLALVALALVVHVAASVSWVVPGHISIDEGVYELMVDAWARGDGFTIRNGYEDLPSRELYFQVLESTPQVLEAEGRLVAKYPYLLPVLAQPLVLLQGYRGLFTLNALAFLGLAGLVFVLAHQLLEERRTALLAVLIFGLGGYAWEYSQAAWPHMTAVLASTGGLALLLWSSRARGARALGFAACAGLVFGLGLGLRLDVALAMGAGGLALLLLPSPWWRALALGGGCVPGLLLLAWSNRVKFGQSSPFSYGTAQGTDFIGLVGLALLALAALVLVSSAVRRAEVRAWLLRRRFAVGLAVAAVMALTLALPALRGLVIAELAGLRDLVWDLRFVSMEPDHPYHRLLPRSPGGAVLYLGGAKKALLQSLPWLPVLLLPLAASLRNGERRAQLLLLFLVPLVYLAPFALTSWHGGQCLNLRYFLPALPFTAILGAWALQRLATGRAAWLVAAGSVALGALLPALLWPALREQQPLHEALVLDAPLVLASTTAAVALLWLRSRGPRVGLALVLVTGLGLGWSAWAGLAYDAGLSRQRRAQNLDLAEAVAEVVPDGALVFVTIDEPFYALKRLRDVTVANPSYDNGADFVALAGFHLDQGRPVLGSMPQDAWQQLDAAGLLSGFRVEGLRKDGQFITARITSR
jgi:hypothetical protein